MKLTFDQTRSSAIAALELQETASTLVVSYHSAPSMGYVFGILDLPAVVGALKRFSTDSQVSIGSTVAKLRADCSLMPLADPTDLRRQQCIEPTFGECLKQWQQGTMSLTGREAATLSNLISFLPKTTVAARAREALVATAAKAGGRGQAARQASSKRLFYWAQGHKTPKP